ncbi:nucleoside-diphosphate-sugar epimerase [Microbacterium testaceum]|uniref:NAD-dependent epimerase/dehydratase family protein n=1 Tax=Microbacterium testaceum TaxID=2033 RepID=UPI002787F59B|nr:NAD-dependent epimerase/dehydratase family protein [Microbacterium testaceum]MDQ1174073.1 nucleoside-diphosphate-sugar epimerase [Microbacterium testaceum]
MNTSHRTMLVTGATGYLGSRIVADLLQRGTPVRAAIRSLEAEPALRAAVRRAGVDDAGLEVAVASLTDDAGWDAAVSGVAGVHHVASPMTHATEDADLVVTPARDGALRVLRAARDAGVKRVVLTSSFAAVGYSAKPVNAQGVREFDEGDWTDPDTAGLPAYPRSKAVAERAAWDFVEREGSGLELVVLNPTWIAGPSLTADPRSSLQAFLAILGGQMPLAPRQRFGVVDVRDVATAHLAAMDAPDAVGRRYLLLADGPTTSWLGVASVLREHLGELASKAPVEEVPGDDLPPLVIHNERAKAELGFAPRPADTTLIDTVDDLRTRGLIGA